MGAQPTWRKLWIALSLLSNPFLLLLDKLGLVKKPLYNTRRGMSIYTRGQTTDINDVVVVLSGNEYPFELLGLASQSPVVVDGGAHIGSFTLYLKSLYPQSRIWALEPVAENRELFQSNVALNKIDDVALIPYALYGQAGRYYIDLSGKQFDALQVSDQKPDHDNFLEIEALPLDEIISRYNIPTIDLLKLDVEGSEYHIFEHSLDQLARSVKRLIMEFHPAGDQQKRDWIVKRLCEQGPFELVYETKNILGFKNKQLN